MKIQELWSKLFEAHLPLRGLLQIANCDYRNIMLYLFSNTFIEPTIKVELDSLDENRTEKPQLLKKSRANEKCPFEYSLVDLWKDAPSPQPDEEFQKWWNSI